MVAARMWWLLKKARGSRILNIGCVGKFTLLHLGLQQRNPAAFVIGLDLDETSLLRLMQPRTVVGDALALPFTEKFFDVVVLGEIIEHTTAGQRLLEEAARVLKYGGRLLLTTPSPYGLLRWLRRWLLARSIVAQKNIDWFLGSPGHLLLWEPLSLMNMLYKLGLQIEECTTRGFRVPYIARAMPALSSLDIPCWPFSRLGNNSCIIARKRNVGDED